MSEIDAKEIDVASLGEALEDKDNKQKPSPSDVRKDENKQASDESSPPFGSKGTNDDTTLNTQERTAPDVQSTSSTPAAPRPLTTHDDCVDYLWTMFPTLKRDTVSDVLRSKRGNTHAAVPLLLEISDPDSVSSDRTMHPHTFMPTYEPRVRANRRKPFEPKWDPALLQYSPRIRPPSTNPHPSTLQRPPPEPSFWPGPEEARQWSDDLNRFTEQGIAKVGSTLSQLRQKAEAALRNREAKNRLFRPQNVGTAPIWAGNAQDASEYEAAAPSSSSWNPVAHWRKQPYDNDPQMLSDAQLEHFMHSSTVPLPSRLQKPLPPHSESLPEVPPRPDDGVSKASWGQRYTSQAENQKMTESTARQNSNEIQDSKLASLEDRPASALATDKKLSSEPTTPPAADGFSAQKHDHAQDTNEEHASKATPSGAEDDEYINNPFDDED